MADQFTLQHGGSDQFLEQWGIVPQPAIPFTTPDDNGKVLGVSEGQYALVSGGGGGSVEPLIVTDTDGTIDATYNEMKTALLAGKTVWLYLEDDDSNAAYRPLVTLGIDTGYYFCAFSDGGNRSNYGNEDADTDMSSPNG